MEHEKIENYVTELLEISGIGHEDKRAAAAADSLPHADVCETV